MRRSYLIIVLLPLFLAACGGETRIADPYVIAIDSLRLAKDAEFRDPATSPLDDADLAGFQGLNYFPVDTVFRVMAVLETISDPDTFEMPTTTERRPLYVRYALLRFRLEGREFTLEAYRNLDLVGREGYEDYLFVPFRDLSGPGQSYGGGRYIDLHAGGPGEVLLDFNTAYNPYCAYSARWSCPIPPEANRLDIAILAGEKRFGEH